MTVDASSAAGRSWFPFGIALQYVRRMLLFVCSLLTCHSSPTPHPILLSLHPLFALAYCLCFTTDAPNLSRPVLSFTSYHRDAPPAFYY